jgi:hypothetical protein
MANEEQWETIEIQPGRTIQVPVGLTDEQVQEQVDLYNEEFSNYEPTPGRMSDENTRPTPPWYQGPLEFAKGLPGGAAQMANIVPNTANWLTSTAQLLNPWGDGTVNPNSQMEPWMDVSDRSRGVAPVEPGYEGWRETGELYGNAVGTGATTGAAVGGAASGGIGTIPGAGLGAATGTTAATMSLLAEKLGEFIDPYTEHPENRRFEQLGANLGGLLPMAWPAISGIATRSKYTGPQTRQVQQAAKRQGVPQSVALVGGDQAKTYPTGARLYRRQREALQARNEEAVTGIRGNAPEVPPYIESIGPAMQEAATEGRVGARENIRNLQDPLDAAAGGEFAWLEPWQVERQIESMMGDPRMSSELPHLQTAMNEWRSLYRPKDTNRQQALETALAAQQAALARATTPQGRLAAQQAIGMIRQGIRDNTGVNEAATRKFASRLKTVLADPNTPGLTIIDIAPIVDAAESTRALAAQQQSGMPRAEWDAAQQASHPLYETESYVKPLSTEADKARFKSATAYDEFLGPEGEVTPARLQAVRENMANPEDLAGILAANYGMKTMPGGVFDPASGRFFGSIGPQMRGMYAEEGTPLRQNLEDISLLAGNMPGAPRVSTLPTVGEVGVGGAAKTASLRGNLATLLALPAVARAGRGVLRKALGTNPDRAMGGSNIVDLLSGAVRVPFSQPTLPQPDLADERRFR